MAYMVRDAHDNDLRIIRIPDDRDPEEQLGEGEHVVEYDPVKMGRPSVSVS